MLTIGLNAPVGQLLVIDQGHNPAPDLLAEEGSNELEHGAHVEREMQEVD